MKKFMKAIAFATVMCMLLSTVAFAANDVPETADADKTFVVTVTEAGANEQVALMVVEAKGTPDYDFSKPLYINQQGANAEGDTTFTAKIADDVAAVDVYVGYAANKGDKAVYVGAVALEKAITEVTITKVDTEIVSAEGAQQIGAGVAIEFDVEAPDGVAATNMIWAIRYTEDGVEKVKYTDSMDVRNYDIGNTLTTGIKLGLAFLNGFEGVDPELEDIASVEITDVDAIFMFTDDEVVFTNANDVANEK